MSIIAPSLNLGDTIGIVTLGSPLDANIINTRADYLKGLGYNVIFGKYVYSYEGFVASSPSQRAEDLMSMFINPNVKAILPSRGGVGVLGILPYLDYNIILNNPKIISGYSDITVLLNALYKYCELISFHSLLLIDFKPDTPEYNLNQYFSLITPENFPRQIENPPGLPLVSRVSGIGVGNIVGGNLTSFVTALDTPFELDTDGKILLIEEVHEPINTVYRYLLQLRTAGKFNNVSGIVLGECSQCQSAYGKTYEDLITDFFIPLGIPLMTNLTSGHGYYKANIPIGAMAELNTFNNTLTILEPTVYS